MQEPDITIREATKRFRRTYTLDILFFDKTFGKTIAVSLQIGLLSRIESNVDIASYTACARSSSTRNLVSLTHNR